MPATKPFPGAKWGTPEGHLPNHPNSTLAAVKEAKGKGKGKRQSARAAKSTGGEPEDKAEKSATKRGGGPKSKRGRWKKDGAGGD